MNADKQTSPEKPANTDITLFIGGAGALPKLWHSLDPSQRQAKIDLMGALNGECIQLSDVVGKPIRIRDIVLQRVLITPEKGAEGEVVEAIRTVLIADDNERYAACATGVDSSIVALCSLFGNPTWTTPITVQAVTRKTRKGFKTLILDLVDVQ